ncbi:hypothetical protein P8625_00385 [Tenacibaculum tangerinum]|uniref:Uncharacterized protein n=1 Tax=Tenacibaculum tangerinum TaxID=3038772 RepID=A0ABY8L2J1_9FLAO|nr:hypothetical protein [Tenacibaculum tangerinum]WGH75654.1 hypothetical protein P8625_00385 [Tenacibaculum tangerinum]
MKKIIYLLFVSLFISTNVYSQKNQKIELFGEKIKAIEITGIKKFNDLGTFSTTTVINDLTDDLDTFLWRLGTVRYDKNNYRKGIFSLFDLSNYDSKDGYPILDLIDFKYYEEVGFELLETKDSLLREDDNYLAFKTSFKSGDQTAKRKLLWKQENYEIREKLIRTKYYVNVQPISNDVTKKLKTTITDSLNVDFKSVIDKIPSSKLDDTNKAKLSNYLKKVNEKNQDLLLEGEYVSAIFNTRYISIVEFIISGVKNTDLDLENEFDYSLNKYIKNIHNTNKKVKKHALNSAVYGFKFSGRYDLLKINSLDIKTELNISVSLSVEISNKLNLEIENTYNRTFKNEFDKLWIIMFATDGVLKNLNIEKR